MRMTVLLLAMAAVVAFAGVPAMAEDGNQPNPSGGRQARTAAEEEGNEDGMTYPRSIAVVGACLGAAVAALGGGMAVANIGGKCIESMARQPEAAGAMFAPMIITAAMVEGGMLFAILVCLLRS